MKYPRWWDETVTILHKERRENPAGKTKTEWRCEFAQNCFWGTTQKQIFADNVLIMQDALIVRIPAGQCEPLNKGDIVIKGEAAGIVNGSGNEILNKYKGSAFVVNTAKANTKLRNAHYYGSDV